jgi:hypothetical protein
MTAYDPRCVKTAEAPKPREWLSEIAQNRPRSEIAIALKERFLLSIFHAAAFLHSQDPTRTLAEL